MKMETQMLNQTQFSLPNNFSKIQKAQEPYNKQQVNQEITNPSDT